MDEAFACVANAKANAEKYLNHARARFEGHLPSVFTLGLLRIDEQGNRRTMNPPTMKPSPAGLLPHSDRGVHYASGEYRAALAQAGLLAAMSRTGNCYDNAAMESFWRTRKLELSYRCNCATHAPARPAIFDDIAACYHRQRQHSSPQLPLPR